VQVSEVITVASSVIGALGDPYITAAQLKARLGIADSVDDTAAAEAVLTASRAIDRHCNRQFNRSETAVARTIRPDGPALTRVPDFWTTDGLAIATDTGGDGGYSTTWSADDYELAPLDGMVDGELGWPYNSLYAIGSYYLLPSASYVPRRAPVRITAKWGWAAVPSAVISACYLLAADALKMKEAAFGVTGFGEFGPMRVRQNSGATAYLAPYVLDPVMVA
jgi:hypothetical protein